MATYFLRVKIFSRGRGARVTRAVAYRAGERIVDERAGEVHNFASRNDVAHKEIVLPSELAGRADMEWARDRSTLWNAAEHAGRARNSRLAREVLVALPPELTLGQRINLVRTFSQELADKYHNAVDIAIHPPRAGSDERNHHAHIVMTSREVTSRGLGARTSLELSGTERHARGLGPSKADFLMIRERWAQVANEALREAGIEARIDHRSLREQGIDREPKPDIPLKVHHAERRLGRSTRAGDEIRARYRERVEARQRGDLANVVRRQKEEDRQRAIAWAKQREALPKKIPRSALTREERNQKDRERRKLNSKTLSPTAAVPTADESARKWQEFRDSRKEVSTAEESVRKWLEFRESQREAPTAEESARKWLEFTERQKAEPSQATAQEHTYERPSGRYADNDDEDDDGRKANRERDNDLGL